MFWPAYTSGFGNPYGYIIFKTRENTIETLNSLSYIKNNKKDKILHSYHMVHNTQQLFRPNIFRIQFYLLVEILRVALLRALQVNWPARNSMLAKFTKQEKKEETKRPKIRQETHQNLSSSGTAIEQVWDCNEHSSWQRLTLTRFIWDDPVDRGALPRVPVVVALWGLVALVGIRTERRAPWYAPERWGIAAVVLVRAATQTVNSVVSCMLYCKVMKWGEEY